MRSKKSLIMCGLFILGGVITPIAITSCGKQTYHGYADFYDGDDGNTGSYSDTTVENIGNKIEYWIGGSRTSLKRNGEDVSRYRFDVTSSNDKVIKILQIDNDKTVNKFHLLFLDIGTAKISANFYINKNLVDSISKTWTISKEDLDNSSYSYGQNIFSIEKNGSNWDGTNSWFNFAANSGGIDIYSKLKYETINNIDVSQYSKYIDEALSLINFTFDITNTGGGIPLDWHTTFEKPTQTEFVDKIIHYGVWHFRISPDYQTLSDAMKTQQWNVNIKVSSNNNYQYTYGQFNLYCHPA